MTAMDKIKAFFKRSKPQVKAEGVKPVVKGAETEVAKAPESKADGATEQKGVGST